MPEYDNTNRGAIWRNSKKTTENHPDFTGEINVDGRDYWLSGWQKKPGDKNNAPVVKFSIKAKDDLKYANRLDLTFEKKAQAPVADFGATEDQPSSPIDYDDIPF